jgi:hypothetical protein
MPRISADEIDPDERLFSEEYGEECWESEPSRDFGGRVESMRVITGLGWPSKKRHNPSLRLVEGRPPTPEEVAKRTFINTYITTKDPGTALRAAQRAVQGTKRFSFDRMLQDLLRNTLTRIDQKRVDGKP